MAAGESYERLLHLKHHKGDVWSINHGLTLII